MLDTAALAGELAGVTLPDTLKSGEMTLKLNGLGLRKKSMFKVYVGGLYLESPSEGRGRDPGDRPGEGHPDVFPARPDEGAARRGLPGRLRGNVKDKAAEKAAFDKMLALVPDVKEGDTLTFTYLPGKGTTLQLGTKELGVFEGKGFAEAVFSIWLGPKPPSDDLKKGMLGM